MFYIGIVSEGMWWRNNAAGLMNAAFRISMMNGRSCRLSFRQKTSESCFVGVQCAHYLEPDYQSGTRSHFWRGETDLWGSVSATLYAFFQLMRLFHENMFKGGNEFKHLHIVRLETSVEWKWMQTKMKIRQQSVWQANNFEGTNLCTWIPIC